MKPEFFFILLGAIYLAPNVTPGWRLGMGGLCFVLSAAFFLARAYGNT